MQLGCDLRSRLDQPVATRARSITSETARITSSRTPEGAMPISWRTCSKRKAATARGNRLVEDGKRIPHRSVARLRQQAQSILVGLDLFKGGEIFQLLEHLLEAHRTKAEMLAPRLRMVCGISSGCVVAIMKPMWLGGSSSVLSNALKAASVIWWASSRI